MPTKTKRKFDIPYRIGLGYDIHELIKGRKLFLGGVEIPHAKGLLGHSDADVVIHAVCDALLGAIGAGDIGEHFSNTDPKYRNISSLILLAKVYALVKGRSFKVGNVDVTILAEEPKVNPYKIAMRETIAGALTISADAVNIKATTQEGLGFGSKIKHGIAVYVVVFLYKTK